MGLEFPDSKWIGYIFQILSGFEQTLLLAVLGSIVATLAGFTAGLARLSSSRPVQYAALGCIEFFRGTSLFVQVFWAYFVLPLLGVPLTALQAGVLALGLNVGAYMAEVVRAAILAVPKDQWEACRSINLTRLQSLRYVIFPQAFVIMLPTLGNLAVELVKNTSVLSLISIADITFQGQTVRLQTGNTAIPFVTVLILYFLLTSTVTFLFTHLEAWMRKRVPLN